jgi:hypothetical protein
MMYHVSAVSCWMLHSDDSGSYWTFPGFKVVNVPLDGDCMFGSIAHQLFSLETG